MRLTVVGSGDAFGSGGRLQACFHLEHDGRAILLDCGVTAIMGLTRLGLQPNTVDTILVSHLHGDHFGGLIWWLLHAVYVTRRQTPLTIAGPAGIEARFIAATEALYPGVLKETRRFALTFVEVTAGRPAAINGIEVLAYLASHPSGAPSHLMRVGFGGRTIAYSGDTEWVEDLVPCQAGGDLFICECQSFRRKIPAHMSFTDLEANRARLSAKRILITHMGAEMLANAPECLKPPYEAACDGLVVELG